MKRPALILSIRALLLAGGFWLLRGPAPAASDSDFPVMTVYKSPTCGCCTKWIDHLVAAGFTVETVDRRDMNPIKAQYRVPGSMESCHTGIIDGYVVEGHVPAEDVKRMLAERLDAAGIAVPGMPIGSPGMEGPNPQRYEVLAFNVDGTRSVFARH